MTEPEPRHELLRQPPAPTREFADRLRDRLRELDALGRRPPHFWALVVAYALAGIVLLIVAVAGVGI